MATYSPTGSPMDEVEIPDCPVHDSGVECDECGGYIPHDYPEDAPLTDGHPNDEKAKCIHPGAYETNACLDREWC